MGLVHRRLLPLLFLVAPTGILASCEQRTAQVPPAAPSPQQPSPPDPPWVDKLGKQAKPAPAESASGLGGLKRVTVLVEELDPEGARRANVSKAGLETVIRAALIRSRAPAFDDSLYLSGNANLYLEVSLLPLSDRRHVVYNVRLALRQNATLHRKDSGDAIAVPCAATWEKGSTGICPDGDAADKIKSVTRDFMDEFAVDYSRENSPAEQPKSN